MLICQRHGLLVQKNEEIRVRSTRSLQPIMQINLIGSDFKGRSLTLVFQFERDY